MNEELQKAYRKYISNRGTSIKDYGFHPIGDSAGVVEYRYRNMNPPDNTLYYQPVRFASGILEDMSEITSDFDYAVIMAIAFKHGKHGYSSAARRLLIEE